MGNQDLKELGFRGPWPHGEYYLYDPKHARKNEWCIIMCVYPPLGDGYEWTASYNGERGMWSNDDRFYNSGWIDFTTRAELEKLIQDSKDLKDVEIGFSFT